MASMAYSDRQSPFSHSARSFCAGGPFNADTAPAVIGHAGSHSASHNDRRQAPTNPAPSSAALCQLIESEIIPRMMLAHCVDPAQAPLATIAVEEAAALAALVMQLEVDALFAHIDAVLARGVSVATVMIDLLAPTARLLGEYWETDRNDFVDVTMGLWRLQEVVREIAGRASLDRLLATGGRKALFASVPGDQHTFGTMMIDEIFRLDGWVTDRLSMPTTSDLLKCAGSDWFDLIGLTASSACHAGDLKSLIVALRNVSRNPDVCIMVGGPLINGDVDQVAVVGADGTAPDARMALKVAAHLVRSRGQEALA